MENGESIISLAIGILGLALSFLLYYLPSIYGKRMACVRIQFGKRFWFLLFNTSRKRIITREDVYRNLYFDKEGITKWEIVKNRLVEAATLTTNGTRINLSFECMEPLSFLVIKLRVSSRELRPKLCGYLKDGNIRDWYPKISVCFSLFSHTYLFEIFIPVLFTGFAWLAARCGLLGIEESKIRFAFLVCLLTGLAVSALLHFYRRIPNSVYQGASEEVCEEILPVLGRRLRITLNRCLMAIRNVFVAFMQLFRCFGEAFRDVLKGGR